MNEIIPFINIYRYEFYFWQIRMSDCILTEYLVELQTSDGAVFFLFIYFFNKFTIFCMLIRTLYHSLLAFNISMIYLLISIFHLM